jgi:hypothetical protein
MVHGAARVKNRTLALIGLSHQIVDLIKAIHQMTLAHTGAATVRRPTRSETLRKTFSWDRSRRGRG